MKLSLSLRAGYTFFYCQTFEMDRYFQIVQDEIKELKQWQIVTWDFIEGQQDPAAVIELLKSTQPYTAIICKNLNWFLKDNFELIQFIQNSFEDFASKEFRKALIILSDEDFNTAIPSAIKKEFIKLDFSLPTKEEIAIILEDLLESTNGKIKSPSSEEKNEIISAALGMTARAIQNAFAYSVIQDGQKINPKIVAEMRSAEINETSGLKVGQYQTDDIIGYDIAKDFIQTAIRNPQSKGVLLLGPAGTGKTCLGKWASTISNKIFIEFELAGVQGQGLYGQAEAEMSNALKVIESIKNCVLFIDEIEKSIPSKQSSGIDTTGTRSFSQLLKFLSDNRPEGCFVMATCNDISKLPPEWIRSERFDVIFFIDLPNNQQKEAIFQYYLKKYNVKSDGFSIENMPDWTGAEIKTSCRLASILGKTVKEASQFVVPIAKTMKQDIDNLRTWAKDKTIPASSPEIKRTLKRSIEIKR